MNLHFIKYPVIIFQKAISELPFASFSRRVLVRNHSNENEFDSHENQWTRR